METIIIAEAGVNYNGNITIAKQLIDCASNAEANFVKFQTFCAAGLVSKNASKAAYQLLTTNHNESQFDMIKKLELDEAAHHTLIDYCRKKNIQFLSTPFDIVKYNLP